VPVPPVTSTIAISATTLFIKDYATVA
jgi:hypothetical protein